MTIKPEEDDEMNTVNLNVKKHSQNGPHDKTGTALSAKDPSARLIQERIENHQAALKSITSELSGPHNSQPINQDTVIGFINNALNIYAIENAKMENPWLYPCGKTFLGDVDVYRKGLVLCDIVTGPFAGNLLDITDQSSIKIVPRNQSNGLSII